MRLCEIALSAQMSLCREERAEELVPEVTDFWVFHGMYVLSQNVTLLSLKSKCDPLVFYA